MDENRVESDEGRVPVRKHFFIATSDEGDVWSAEVKAIVKYSDDQTRLNRIEGLSYAIVDAPIEIVRAVFKEHGFEFVSEGDLKKRTEQYRAAQVMQP